MIAMPPRRHRSYRQSCAVLIASAISCRLFSSLLGMSSRLRCRARLAGASALLLLLGVATMSAYAQNVTFAGAQTTVPATGLGYAFGVAVDAAGDVFISDRSSSEPLSLHRWQATARRFWTLATSSTLQSKILRRSKRNEIE